MMNLNRPLLTRPLPIGACLLAVATAAIIGTSLIAGAVLFAGAVLSYGLFRLRFDLWLARRGDEKPAPLTLSPAPKAP